MKKIIALVAVVALTASCFASSISFTATTTGMSAGQVQISYSASGGVPVGISMKLSRSTGTTAYIANRAAIVDGDYHKVYVDWIKSNSTANMSQSTGIDTTGAAHPMALYNTAGAAVFPIGSTGTSFPVALCMGDLDGTPGATGIVCKITFTSYAAHRFTLDVDSANRGGVVDATGAAMTTNLPITFGFPGGCATCKGDANGSGKVNATDITVIVGWLTPRTVPPYTPPAYTIPSTDPMYNNCADYNSDNKINATDITQIVSLLTPRTVPPYSPPAYTYTCP
jgi:hypothetical protein